MRTKILVEVRDLLRRDPTMITVLIIQAPDSLGELERRVRDGLDDGNRALAPAGEDDHEQHDTDHANDCRPSQCRIAEHESKWRTGYFTTCLVVFIPDRQLLGQVRQRLERVFAVPFGEHVEVRECARQRADDKRARPMRHTNQIRPAALVGPDYCRTLAIEHGEPVLVTSNTNRVWLWRRESWVDEIHQHGIAPE